MSDARWIRIAGRDSVPPREGRAALVGDREIALFNLGDRFVAVDNRCPHRGGPLADGIVAGDTVTCPLHGRRVDLRSGSVDDCDESVPVYDVEVIDGVVVLWR